MMRKLLKSLVALTLAGTAVAAASGCTKEKAATAPVATTSPDSPQKAAIRVTENGYEPSPLTVRKDVPVELTVTRTTDQTCATELVLDEYDIHAKLPLNEPVTLRFTPTKSGELRYGCAMGKMVTGVLKVE